MVHLSEVDSSFWGTLVEGGKTYTIEVERNFILSMAAIDPFASQETEPVTLYMKNKDVEYVLCTLVPGKIYQEKLDLAFEMGEELNLVVKGKGKIHLTGYYTPENYESDGDDFEDYEDDDDEGEDLDDEDMMEMMDEEDEEEDEEEEEMVQGKRKKAITQAQQPKKVKFEEKKNDVQKKTDKKEENKPSVQKQQPQQQKKDNNQKQQQNNNQKQQQKDNQKQNNKPQEVKNAAQAPAGDKKKNKKKKNKKNKNAKAN